MNNLSFHVTDWFVFIEVESYRGTRHTLLFRQDAKHLTLHIIKRHQKWNYLLVTVTIRGQNTLNKHNLIDLTQHNDQVGGRRPNTAMMMSNISTKISQCSTETKVEWTKRSRCTWRRKRTQPLQRHSCVCCVMSYVTKFEMFEYFLSSLRELCKHCLCRYVEDLQGF